MAEAVVVKREPPFSLRLSPDDRREVVKAARRRKVPLGTFVREAAVAHARRVNRHRRRGRNRR